MSITSNGTKTATIGCWNHAERAPFAMPAASMCMFATASAKIIGTDVMTSVSLFVLVLFIVPNLLPELVVLITLLLIGLTRLVKLESLVGQVSELNTSTARGD